MQFILRLSLCVITICVFVGTPNIVSAEKMNIAYGGLWTIESSKYKLLNDSNRALIAQHITELLQEKIDNGEMKIPIVIDTDSQRQKSNINNWLTLVLLVTRADYSQERLEAPGLDAIYSGNVYCSLSVLVLDSIQDEAGAVQHRVVTALPRVGFQRYRLPSSPSVEQLDESLQGIAINLFQDYFLPRLNALSFDQIQGSITDVKQGKAIVDIGRRNGLEKGNSIWFLTDNKKCFGRISKLESNSAEVDFSQSGMNPPKGVQVHTIDTRAVSSDTYQVVNTTITSPKLQRIFGDEDITSQLAQWFSDYLAKEKGIVVLPAVSSQHLITGAHEEAVAIIGPGQQKMTVTIPSPKYTMSLNVTGVNSGVVKAGANQKYIVYKAWLQGELRKDGVLLPKYPQTVDHHLSQMELTRSSVSEIDVFRNLLEQTALKFAREMRIE